MDPTTLASLVLNGILAVCMYLLKVAHTDVRDQIKENKDKIDLIKDNYMKKDDFKDFKEELWKRLDRVEEKVANKGA